MMYIILSVILNNQFTANQSKLILTDPHMLPDLDLITLHDRVHMFSPLNENLNLLVRIKFLNLFFYISKLKTEKLY